MSSPETRSVTPECQIVVFNWKSDTDIEDLSVDELSQSIPHDISNYIREYSFSKQLSNASGQFQITLENDRDWKQFIRKGSWCLIYMSNDGGLSIPNSLSPKKVNLGKGLKGDEIDIISLKTQTPKLRCIGYIDTVRAQGTVGDEKGEFDTTFTISGRDFGVVYEETEIWHNTINFDQTLLNTAVANINSEQIKTVDKLLKTLHQLIFSPYDIVNKDKLKDDSLTSIALQWLLPYQLFTALGISPRASSSYFGNIPNLLNFSPTKATYPVESPVALMNGVAWQQLKSYSIEPYHELFAELDNNGLPRLNFRPIPWRLTAGNKYKDLSPFVKKFASDNEDIIELTGLDLVNFDLGEDNHTRYNLFWSTVKTSTISIQTSNQLIGDNSPKTGFPRVRQNSVRRHGLRLLYSEVNANIVLGQERANPDLVRQFNEVALEYWGNSHLLESGTIDIIGNNEVRLGKVIHIDDNLPYNADKYFYIEGYEETFTVGENGETFWSQGLFVTRGIERERLNDQSDLGTRSVDYKDRGDFTGN